MEEIEVGHVYIPGHIMARTDINLQCKCVYGKIVALTGKKGYCYASNGWLGKEIGLAADTISTYVSKLVSLNLLKINVDKIEGQGTKRRLFAFMPGTPNPLGQTAELPLGQTAASVSNSIDPIDESVKNSLEEPMQEPERTNFNTKDLYWYDYNKGITVEAHRKELYESKL